MLTLKNVSAAYGKIGVLKNINLEVHDKEVVAIIGANGAGKTTTLNVITGLMKPTAGTVRFDGLEISSKKYPAQKITGLGITICPQGRQVFPYHTVKENLMLGGHLIQRDKQRVKRKIEEIYDLYPVLKERSHQLAGTLSGGEQQMLSLGRSMMIDPKLLLLDEPSAGLAPKYVKDVFDMIKRLTGSGATILVVEQMAKMALKVADRAYVLETGKITMEGTGSGLLHNPKIIESYLGGKK